MSAVLAPPPPLLPKPRIGDEQRLRATLVFSFLLHALVIFGVGFALDRAAPVVPMLDVILTQTQTPLTPKQADFLAQANNQGGGDHDKSNRPRDIQPGLVPQLETGAAPRPVRAQTTAPSPPPQARIVSSTRGETQVAAPNRDPKTDPLPLPLGRQKVEHDMEMARLAAEIHLNSNRYAKRPSRKFVSASTQEYAWATYLRTWVDRAERVGNLNYPDEARRRRLSGTVVINVGVRRNGSLERIDVVQSSGIKLLDDAAVRIARLAEPYPALPKTQENPDILNVIRTWRFLPEGTLIDE
jgi:periplasmic protein TonB